MRTLRNRVAVVFYLLAQRICIHDLELEAGYDTEDLTMQTEMCHRCGHILVHVYPREVDV